MRNFAIARGWRTVETGRTPKERMGKLPRSKMAEKYPKYGKLNRCSIFSVFFSHFFPTSDRGKFCTFFPIIFPFLAFRPFSIVCQPRAIAIVIFDQGASHLQKVFSVRFDPEHVTDIEEKNPSITVSTYDSNGRTTSVPRTALRRHWRSVHMSAKQPLSRVAPVQFLDGRNRAIQIENR